jgi:hypothetical protein
MTMKISLIIAILALPFSLMADDFGELDKRRQLALSKLNKCWENELVLLANAPDEFTSIYKEYFISGYKEAVRSEMSSYLAADGGASIQLLYQLHKNKNLSLPFCVKAAYCTDSVSNDWIVLVCLKEESADYPSPLRYAKIGQSILTWRFEKIINGDIVFINDNKERYYCPIPGMSVGDLGYRSGVFAARKSWEVSRIPGSNGAITDEIIVNIDEEIRKEGGSPKAPIKTGGN